jgi:hypothetical protein
MAQATVEVRDDEVPPPGGPGLGVTATEPQLPAAFAARLLSHVVVTGPRDDLPVISPLSERELGRVPSCTAADVEEAVRRTRSAQGAWAARLRAGPDEGPATARRPGPLPPGGGPRPHPARVGQGTRARLRGGGRRLDRGGLLRAHGRRSPARPAARGGPSRCSPRPPRSGTRKVSSGSSRRGTTPSPWRSPTRSRPCWRGTRASSSPPSRRRSPRCGPSSSPVKPGCPTTS